MVQMSENCLIVSLCHCFVYCRGKELSSAIRTLFCMLIDIDACQFVTFFVYFDIFFGTCEDMYKTLLSMLCLYCLINTNVFFFLAVTDKRPLYVFKFAKLNPSQPQK